MMWQNNNQNVFSGLSQNDETVAVKETSVLVMIGRTSCRKSNVQATKQNQKETKKDQTKQRGKNKQYNNFNARRHYRETDKSETDQTSSTNVFS